MTYGSVPTAVFGPALEKLLEKYGPDGQLVIAGRAGVHVDTVGSVVRQRRAHLDFNIADRLLCVMNAHHLWWTELRDIYYDAMLSKQCEARGCEVTFELGAQNKKAVRFCSEQCRYCQHKYEESAEYKAKKLNEAFLAEQAA